ncbi:VanZ family protein [Flavobacterium faecale]|uniref:VanZ family protein n=1 Tax=Flavobacterium faecale TaxID=1355330 RepID=UPI001FECA0DF|nr:VanZ family protein [Flavobacterium faecale]
MGAAISWTFIVLVMCLAPLDGAPKIRIDNFDKYVHATFHFVFTTLWFLYFRLEFKESAISKALTSAFLFSVSTGIAIEFMQKYFTENRAADPLDVVANMFGATIAIAFCCYLGSLKIIKNCLK